jgi:drug/metabolite transporter (DMT)-like permease
VLATTCAVVYGAADFYGGLATRRSQVFAVVVLSQIAGLVFIIAMMPLLPGASSPAALLWGMLAGTCGGLGLIVFYRALATGTMSVVAPTTAATSAGLPVLFGLATGERPHLMALAGIALGIFAILLVSREPTTRPPKARGTVGPLIAALVSGAGFGGFFILLSHAPSDAGLWPLLGARAASITLVSGLAVATGRGLRPGKGALWTIALAGVLDMAANVLYLLAVQRGLLSLVAVIVSLYPASTLVLARRVLGERLSVLQIAGVGFALGAVALIAAS